ncbi:MAG: LacI family DNA-binding transcriptional regulator [Anaerolineae bacterium]|nr:LacI family DNA-binding transcriptional regulator [Anaerolineae bacterium]
MKRTRKSTTMKDVAQLSGVSIQTVSAVINNKSEISDETRARVLAAVKELNYQPDLVARSLRTRQTKTIALVVSNIASVAIATMAKAAEAHAHSLGYRLILYNTDNDSERETKYFKAAVQQWVEGVVFIAAMGRLGQVDILEDAGIPVVAIDRIPDNYSGPAVMLDNFKVGRLAGDHLLDLGHQHLAYIGGPTKIRLARERVAGFQQALEERGIESIAYHTEEGAFSCQHGYLAMQQLLTHQPGPTAVFAANDLMAIGAMRAVDEAGLRVPNDISIVGVDDIEVSAFQTPPLTTVRQSCAELATLGIQLLFDILAEKSLTQTQIVIEPSLIVRQSTTRLG